MEWRIEQEVCTIYPRGDLDLVLARELRSCLEQVLYTKGGWRQLVIQMDGVRLIDSTGLGTLIGCYKIMKARGGSMMLREANATVYRLLELSGLRQLMPITPRQEQSRGWREANGNG